MIKEIKREFNDFRNRIKDTKKYANEKSVHTWGNEIVFSILFVFVGSTAFVLYSILFISQTELVRIIPGSWLVVIPFMPFILTFLFMFRFGHLMIKLMILKSHYIQKGFFKLIDKLDMYFWKKTGKDSLISSFIVKHPKLFRFVFVVPIIVWFVLRWIL